MQHFVNTTTENYRIYGTNAIVVVIGAAARVEQVVIVQAGARILQVEVRIAAAVNTARRQPQKTLD